MLASALFSVIWAAGVGLVLIGLGCGLIYVAQGGQMARDFLNSATVHFNGLLVFATGYGLLGYVRSTGRSLLAQLTQIVHLPPNAQEMLAHLGARIAAWRATNYIAVPLTVVGALVLWSCGYPLAGFARLYLAFWTTSIYYVASAILAFYVYVIALFRFVEEHAEIVTLQRPSLVRRVQVLDEFLIISATMGVLAIYFGFRGTLTANFVHVDAISQDLLMLPLLFYVPTTLLYSFYPRFVLRQMLEEDVVRMTEDLERRIFEQRHADLKDELELRHLVMEIKTRALAERRAIPLLSLKDAPSLTISILILIQFILHRDAVIASFLSQAFHPGGR